MDTTAGHRRDRSQEFTPGEAYLLLVCLPDGSPHHPGGGVALYPCLRRSVEVTNIEETMETSPGFWQKTKAFSTIRFWVFVGENGNLYYYIYISMFMIYYQSIYYIYIFLYTTSFVNFVSIQIQPAPVQGFPSEWDGMGCLKKKAPKIQCERDRFPIHFPIQIAVQRDFWSVFRQASDPFRWSFLFHDPNLGWTLRWGRWGSNAFD